MKYIEEAPRRTPVVREVEVLVVGGGTAGVPAAVAAARNGAKTLLIERYGFLGGFYVEGPGSGALGVVLQDTTGKQIIKGITAEMLDRMVRLGGAVPALDREVVSSTGWPPATPYGKMKPYVEYEAVRTASFEICEEAGVELLLHSWVADAIVEDGAVKGVIVVNKSGRQAILARVVIDCTGDGDVAALAGAPFDKAPRDVVYQISRDATLAGVDTDKLRARAREILEREPERVGTAMMLADPVQVPDGFEAPISVSFRSGAPIELSEDRLDYKRPAGRGAGGIHAGFRKGHDRLTVSVDGYDGTDAFDLTRAEVEARRKLVQRAEWLRKNVPGYEDCYIQGTGESITLGVRETRQVLGDYVMTADDVIWGRKFEDAIARAAHQIDMHLQGGGSEIHGVKADYYEIPYRCLVPREVEDLLVAGRCISCTHEAQAALRKVPICSATGEAAGTAAALAVRAGVAPRQLDVRALQASLTAQGAW